MSLYNQPEKQLARTALLEAAVKALTTGRTSSSLVTPMSFRHLQRAAADFARDSGLHLDREFAEAEEKFNTLYKRCVGRRSAEELSVLYLCGPEPLNDLRALNELGIPNANIWAVESDEKAAEAAATQLKQEQVNLKLHSGTLKEFFELIPEQFDLVYFDACGPLLGGKPSTTEVIYQLFLNQRLKPISSLATNFASATASPKTREEWADRLFCWNAAREVDFVGFQGEPKCKTLANCGYRDFIKENIDDYYGDFISRFIPEFAGILLPWLRTYSLPTFFKEYTSQIKEYRPDPLLHLEKTAYPYFSCAELSKTLLKQGDALRNIFVEKIHRGSKLCDAIRLFSHIRDFDQGITDRSRELCSPKLTNLLKKFTWIGTEESAFCDRPFPIVTLDLLIGQYGFPYHLNPGKSKRLKYRAKSTDMYSDVFVFDTARYLYDAVPTLASFETLEGGGLVSDQLLVRVCMDLIAAHTRGLTGDSRLFWGSSLAGGSYRGIAGLPKRRTIECQ